MKYQPEDEKIMILTGDYRILRFADPADRDSIVELDLGCGKGTFATELARRYPRRTILAADIMIGRLRKLVKRNQREGVENVTPLRTEAGPLLGFMLPDHSIDRLHVLCPDPWPKERHRGNRLISSNLTGQLFRVLKPGGIFHFSTDDEPYHEHVVKVVAASGLFDQAEPEADIVDLKTDFEQRWQEQGKAVRHQYWRRQA